MTTHEHKYQHYALREDDTLVEIHDTSKDDGHVYRCPYCHQEYTPKRGKVKSWHFAHKIDNPEKCSYDNYLHTLAERKILEWYQNTPKIWLQLENLHICKDYQNCVWNSKKSDKDDLHSECKRSGYTKPYNLKDIWETAELEKEVENGKYRADILLTSETHPADPILIEICVTHPCTEEKINSGFRIIEIPIKTEEDITAIVQGYSIKQSENFRMYGFHPKNEILDDAVLRLQKVVVYDSAAIDSFQTTCRDYQNRAGVFEITSLLSGYNLSFYNDGLYLAYYHKKIGKTCNLCKYQNRGDQQFSSTCNLSSKFGTKKYCKDNDANSCQYFRMDRFLMALAMSRYSERKADDYVDIWKKE